MRRRKETERTSPAMIRGFGAVPGDPLELKVSLVNVRGLGIIAISQPFSAFTASLVDQVCGTHGVRLTCGALIPWERLEDHRKLVIVRQPLGRVSGLPTVLLNSLIRWGLRNAG